MKRSTVVRWGVVLLSFLSAAMFFPLGAAAQNQLPAGVEQLRAQSNAWILEHRSRRGYRVADLTDAGRTRAMGLDTVKSAGQWSKFDPPGYSPAQIRHAYGFDQLRNNGKGQVIAIVGAFDYPNAAADLKKFIQTFGLKMMYGLPGTSPCNPLSGPHPCFQVLYAYGVQPAFDEGWALESALDTQWAHAIAQGADIVLVEAATDGLADMFNAALIAGALFPIVSMSWGTTEFLGDSGFDPVFTFSPGVTFLASSGDSGNPGAYPAASPYVVAVGGTALLLDRYGNRRSETAWINSGGGISPYELEPDYQSTYPIPDTSGRRGIPDVAYNADPTTGVSVYDSNGFNGQTGWFDAGGTSAAAPQWAGLIALANELRQLRHEQNLSSTNLLSSPLYNAARRDYRDNFFDIKSGSNGACGSVCTAAKGYDFVTGLGSPKADSLVPALTHP